MAERPVPSLEFADVEVPAEQVHAAFMAALADCGAIVGAREPTNAGSTQASFSTVLPLRHPPAVRHAR